MNRFIIGCDVATGKDQTVTVFVKPSIERRLLSKTVDEINRIAARVDYPLRGNKRERVHSLCGYFRMPEDWRIISSSHGNSKE